MEHYLALLIITILLLVVFTCKQKFVPQWKEDILSTDIQPPKTELSPFNQAYRYGMNPHTFEPKLYFL